MLYLPGIHEPDQQAAALFGDKPGTVVFAEAIGANPNDKSGRDYRWWSDRGFRVIVRLNNGWSPDGTIPASSLYESFAQRCAAYVAASQGCGEWIIGNEFNHLQERPNGTEIKAKDAARCFVLCRNAIKSVQPSARVIVGAIAPWNPQSGDWLAYWKEMLETIAVNGGADGISLHAYTHGSDPSLITSDHRDNGWLWHFRTYQDQLAVVPASMRHLPVDITETNQGDDAWVDANSGWVQAAMREINGWNQQPGTQKIRSVCLYRWPRYDEKYSFADKAGVQDDFREACKQGYVAPEVSGQEVLVPVQQQHDTFIPSVSTDGDNSGVTMPQREISEEFKRRVPTVEFSTVTPGYRLIKAEYVPNGAQRFGPDHHVLVEVLDAQGNRKQGVPAHFFWGDDEKVIATNKPDGPYAVDYAMFNAGHSYGVWIGDSMAASDRVFGMGLGKLGSEHMNEHIDFYLVFQEETTPAIAQPVQPQPTQPGKVPLLVHPIANPLQRTISQGWGGNRQYYSKFLYDNVPLLGHNGIDFAVPIGTEILNVDDGTVKKVAFENEGFGLHAVIDHAWGETLVAHMSSLIVEQGQRVLRGQVLGLSGDSGGVSGAHLHFGLRIKPYSRTDGWGGFVNPLSYLPTDATTPGPFIPTQPTVPQEKQPPARQSYLAWFRQYGTQFGIDWHLLAALAYNENKYQVQPPSDMGALGLMQFMPTTWADMQVQLGVTDVLDPEQSIKAAAFYLAQIRTYLIKHKKMGMGWVLAAYNWGMGNAAAVVDWDKQVPPETQRWVDLNLEFSEALRRWEDGW